MSLIVFATEVAVAIADIKTFIASEPEGVDLNGRRKLQRICDALMIAPGQEPLVDEVTGAIDTLAEWLDAHTDKVFEEIPDIDGARNALQDALENFQS